jgi:hypothetical protein
MGLQTMVWVKTVGFLRDKGKVKLETRLWVGESQGGGMSVWAALEAWKRLQKAEETALAA